MKISEFNALAQAGYRYIPVTRQVLADVETPVSVYAKLANDTYSYLFESVQGGEKWARYSMIGLACRKVFEFSGRDLRVHENGQCVEAQTVSDPLAFIDQYRDSLKVADVLDAQVLSLAPSMKSLPTFQGGLVGYFAYDTVRYVEHRLANTCPQDALGLPDIVLMQSEEVVVFDNLAGSLTLMVLAQVEDGLDEISNAAQLAKAQARLDELQAKLSHQANLRSIDLSTQTSQKATVDEARFTSSFGQDNFYKAVNRIKDYVLDGDTMQVVISQRLSVDFDQSPLDLYRALRSLNPSPYMYLVNLGETHIVGSSPEVLVRSEQSTVTVRPIAGTRRRGLDEAEDIALEKELLGDPKEIAEHLMLIDLGRNDVGRIAKTGSVDVTEQMQIERYSHVMHIVSNVQGELDNDFSALDALKATLPAGTLSGAPKVRAMEIIDELEPVKRGIYGGAVGYLAYNGDMDTAIAIRTAVIHKGQLHVQAGAGVVADSVPELEWKETMNKARALFRAVAMLDDKHDAGGAA